MALAPFLVATMAKRTLTNREKVQAVARLEAGESLQSVARDVGCAQPSLRRWRNKLVDARPDLFPNLSGKGDVEGQAQAAAAIADQIKEKLELRADKLLGQIDKLIPTEQRLDKAAIALGIFIDKLQVMQGKPSSITAETLAVPEDATPAQLETAIAEIRARREREPSQEVPPDVGSGGAHTPLQGGTT